jgi:Fe2+ or Zn2+ uptake regulation protein
VGDVDTDDRLIRVLRAHGHRVTAPRLVVHRHLRTHQGHLAAERVHRDLVGANPSLSPATVYATLDLFADLGLVRRMSTMRGVTLYDTRTDEHHHLVCRSCGAITDLDAAVPSSGAREAAAGHGFRVEHATLQLTGLCADCAATRSAQSAMAP